MSDARQWDVDSAVIENEEDVAVLTPRDEPTARIAGFDEDTIATLHASRVLVVGAGGLGSPVLAYLAAIGIGTIGVADGDTVDETNLGRQVIHTANAVGMEKTQSAARTIAAINPDVTVITHPILTAQTIDAVVREYDLVIDATDTFDAKYLIADACARTRRTHVWGTIVGMEYQVSVFPPGISLRDIYPQAPMVATPSSVTDGVLGAVCGQAGTVMACEAIKLLTGVGEVLAGRLLVVDAARLTWDTIVFHRGEGQ